MKSGKTGAQLGDLIKKAIRDCELTFAEHEEIIALADADGVVDAQEQSQLKQLQELISNGTIKKVPNK